VSVGLLKRSAIRCEEQLSKHTLCINWKEQLELERAMRRDDSCDGSVLSSVSHGK